jgi:hypothetical protein
VGAFLVGRYALVAGATLIEIFQAFAAWEQTELVNASVVAASNFHAFATAPTETDFTAGLTYPYSVHGVDLSTFKRLTLGDPMEDMQTHTIWTFLAWERDSDKTSVILDRNARWTNAYRAALVKHLHLGVAKVLEMATITARFWTMDVEGRPEVGTRFDIPVETRVDLTTGI